MRQHITTTLSNGFFQLSLGLLLIALYFGLRSVTKDSSLSHQNTAAQMVIQEGQYRFSLIRVIDGDTIVGDISFPLNIKIENQHIRFLDFDAPEITRRKGVTPEEVKRGLQIKKELISFLNNKDLKIQIKGRDAFGRVLGTIFADDVNVTDWLISKGHSKKSIINTQERASIYRLKNDGNF